MSATAPGPLHAQKVLAEKAPHHEFPWRALLPRVDVMVTNGGFGGVQFALANGAAIVCCPSILLIIS